MFGWFRKTREVAELLSIRDAAVEGGTKRPEHSLYVNGPEFPVHPKPAMRKKKSRDPLESCAIVFGVCVLIIAATGGTYIVRDVQQRRAVIKYNNPARFVVGQQLLHGRVPVTVDLVVDRWRGPAVGLSYVYVCSSEQFGTFQVYEGELQEPR